MNIKSDIWADLNQQIIDQLNKEKNDAQYTIEEVAHMKLNNDGRLYKSPTDILSSYGCVWENGSYGYFIPFEHRPLGLDFLQSQFGGGQKDGKGLRFVRQSKDRDKPFMGSQSNAIILSGFGEYVLENWGDNISTLCEKYTVTKFNRTKKLWETDNYPDEMNKIMALKILHDLGEAERDRWSKASIEGYLMPKDFNRLSQCVLYYFEWLDKFQKECAITEEPKLPTTQAEVNKKYQIFISSTYIDFEKEREKIAHAIAEMGHIPVGMELFPASTEEQFNHIKRVIDVSDYVVLIIGGRYGSMDEFGISYTEKEYDYAISKGISVLAFIHSEPMCLPDDKREFDKDISQKLDTFREKVKDKKGLCKMWQNASDLHGLVVISLTHEIQEHPAIGYKRADEK